LHTHRSTAPGHSTPAFDSLLSNPAPEASFPPSLDSQPRNSFAETAESLPPASTCHRAYSPELRATAPPSSSAHCWHSHPAPAADSADAAAEPGPDGHQPRQAQHQTTSKSPPEARIATALASPPILSLGTTTISNPRRGAGYHRS